MKGMESWGPYMWPWSGASLPRLGCGWEGDAQERQVAQFGGRNWKFLRGAIPVLIGSQLCRGCECARSQGNRRCMA